MSAAERGELEPLLDGSDIQGNILGGFNKDHQALIALHFDEDEASVSAVRAWLRELLPRITRLDEVVAYRRAFRAARSIGDVSVHEEMPALWTNVAFSFAGLRKLAPDAELFADEPFRDGLPAASKRLGDPTEPGAPGECGGWLIGAPGDVPDLLVIVAGDVADEVADAVEHLRGSAQAAGLRWGRHEMGHDLAFFNEGEGQHYESGREHFGFKDGISQPGVRGRVGPEGGFLTRRTIESPGEDYEVEFSTPGQPLVCAGEFVLGYARQDTAFPRLPGELHRLHPDSGERDPEGVAPAWALNGSFLVYRRLRQDVPAFNRFLAAEAERLRLEPGFETMTPEKLGALLVGRWKSGAPVMRAPEAENVDLGNDRSANNAFGFQTDQDPGDGFPPVPSDADGCVCPIASHIRKVNPRDQQTDVGFANVTLHHMILRRGIPFGRPLPHGALDDPTGEERGLLFLSYQTSIADQFELLAQQWMNQPDGPTNPAGDEGMGLDMIVGQASTEQRVRTCILRTADTQAQVTTEGVAPTEWVIATGGGYFFAPSLSAIANVLAAA